MTGQVVVLDLEFTAWQGSHARRWRGANEWREIVQLGCILVEVGEAFREIASFEALVRPRRNPELSSYFTELTGIGQTELELNGRSLADVVADSGLGGMMSGAEMILFNGQDGEVLRENCVLQNVTWPWPDAHMFNIQPLLSRKLNRSSSELISSEFPRLAGVQSVGRAHTALADCRAIAAALSAWRRAGVL